MSVELVKSEAAATEDAQKIAIPDDLPVLPLPDVVVFPYMIVPLFVNREKSAKAVDQSLSENRMIFLVAQKNTNVEDPKAEDLQTFGTVAIVMRMLKLPDGRMRILVQGFSRAEAKHYDESKPYLSAKVAPLTEPVVVPASVELEALIRNVKASLDKAVALGKNISQDLVAIAANLDDPARLADLVASNLDLKVERAQAVLELLDPVARLRLVHELLVKEVEVLEIQNDINTQARGEIDKSQREFYLRQQMKAIQQELGEGNELQEEIEQYRDKIKKAKMPAEVGEEAERQLSRLERMHPDAAETATLRNYLDWMVGLPWAKSTKDNLDLKKAQNILDEDHYGLEKIKERILEHLAVRKLKKDSKGPILCFVGPPGVGKTSLGRSIARALGRKFVRVSLGGVHDEAEIRGHRRTYVGAMPGRIIQSINQAGTNNPVFMMDEVDKLGADFRGDPSSALLEVLDPEQNFAFRDNYLGVPFDLSNVMFITTANMLDTIQPAFRDRMEIIQLSGYTEQEKLEITKRHLIPKQIEEHGLTAKQIQFTDEAIRAIITEYTQEAGLRNLEREIAAVCRKVARQIASGEKTARKIHTDNLDQYLGRPKILREELLKRDQIGVATGLAWTPVGGDVLFVEATAMRGRGVLMLTGQLGDVMKESAQAALSYARTHAKEFGIKEEYFSKHDIHVHVPEGATPKDGPSAGVTMATAILSLLTGRAVHRKIAMTGEITLRGEVLPVGGIKEKVLAAHRAKIELVILPSLNKRDLEDVSEEIRHAMKFVYVDDVKSVFKEALLHTAAKKQHAAKSAPKGKEKAPADSTLVTLKELGEDGLIDRIRRRFTNAQAVVGIGDDAAIIDPPAGHSIVYCSDLVAEGTHFLRDRHPADSIGYKAVAVNVSDVGAMGGVPRHFLISLAAPPELKISWIDGFLDGIERACNDFEVSLAGGDSSSAERIFVDVSMVGFVPKGSAVLRSGAKPGDLIYVTGQLGGSALGLEQLLAGNRIHPAVRRHLYPTPRHRVGAAVALQARAMIDVSDGLSTDLGHILKESGVSGRIYKDRLPRFPEATDDQVLNGGEEYELLIVAPSLPSSIGGLSISLVGEIIATDPGGALYLNDGSHDQRLSPHGYRHYSGT